MELTRRKLAKYSGALIGLGAFARGRALGANDRIRAALIGCGGRGRGNMAEFLRNRGVECVGLCDVDEANLRVAQKRFDTEFGQHPATLVKDFRRILEIKDLDAVVIGTPDHWHPLITILACQAGKDVYVEKPLAPSIAEGEAMVRAARKYQRIVQAGTQGRSSLHYADVTEYIRSGKLGQIAQVRVFCYLDWLQRLPPVPDSDPPATADYDFWLGPAPKRPFNRNRFHFDFRWHWDYASGLLGDWGVHLLDQALSVMGGKAALAAASTGGKFAFPDDARETPDTQTVIYTYPGYTMIWEHAMGHGIGPSPEGDANGVAYYGSEGLLIANSGGWRVYPESEGTMIRDRAKPRRYKGPGVPKQSSFGDPHAPHVKNFLECMRTRQLPNADVAKCQNTMLACHLGNIAFRTGRHVHWDDARKEITGDSEAQRLVSREYRSPWRLPAV